MATLRVGVAYPDPPFSGIGEDRGGLDVDLITAIGAVLGQSVRLVEYRGADFDGIFDGLAAGDYDCVIAGTSVTPDRSRKADFAAPYLVSGQSLAVDTARLPHVRSIDDLAGLTIGVQHGNTGQPIADRLVADGKAAAVRVYEYDDMATALHDLSSGGCDTVMALFPVLAELVRPITDVQVVQRNISREEIAIAVARGDRETLDRISAAQAGLEEDGTLQGLRRTWLGNPYRDQGLTVH